MAMPTTKPKIGFSIESIVGEHSKEADIEEFDKQNQLSKPTKQEYGLENDQFNQLRLTNDIQKALRLRTCSPNKIYGHLNSYNPPDSPLEHPFHKSLAGPDNKTFKENIQSRTDVINRSPSPHVSANCGGGSQPSFSDSSTVSPPAKVPLVVPGISAGYIMPFSRHDFKPMSQYAADVQSQHNSQLLAAQITAAALSAQSFPPVHQQPPHLHGNPMPRDSYPLYPWLISRHGRIFPHRFPGSK